MTGKLYNNGQPRKSPDETNTKHLRKINCDHLADCDDCGLTSVLNRRICYTKNPSPFVHWRGKCGYCHRYFNPITEQWETISAQELNYVLRRYYTKITAELYKKAK